MSEQEPIIPGAFGLQGVLRSLRRSRLALAGCIILALIVLVAVAAPLLAPYNPEQVDIRNRLLPLVSLRDLLRLPPPEELEDGDGTAETTFVVAWDDLGID